MKERVLALKRLTKNFDYLTESEKRVCTYIIQNYEKIPHMSINQLAQKSYTSKTVVINMAQKLGFEGYTDLRYYLRDETDSSKRYVEEDEIAHKIMETTQMTLKTLNREKLQQVADEIIEAKTVYIAARGTSKAVALHLSHLLLTSGVKCILIDDYNLLPIISHQVVEDELIILISLSGETKKIVDAAQAAKARNAHVVGISSFSHNALSRIADITLFSSASETETSVDDDISRLGFFMIAEILVNQVKQTLENQ